jgi:hypothetical protein
MNALEKTLEKRFNDNPNRHLGMTFTEYFSKLSEKQLNTILMMEATGGEPDLIIIDGTYYVVDLSKETPKGRLSLCYDLEALLSRKKFPPEGDAISHANKIGITLLDESLYLKIQETESLDLKTSSWLLTPTEIREKGGALFGDKRYNRAFIYHNGADSYYNVRGFRGYFKL